VLEDILLSGLRTMRAGDRTRHCLYYHEGNFYFPLSLQGGDFVRVKKAIRIFRKENRERLALDRASLGYQTTVEIFDAQGGER